MLVANNDSIDFAELERRLGQEMARLPQPAVAGPERAVQPAAPAAAAPPASRSLRRTARTVLWGMRNFPSVLRRTAVAVGIAEDLQARVLRLESLERDAAERLERVDQLATMAKTRLRQLDTAALGLASRHAELRTLIDELSTGQGGATAKLADQLGMLRTEVMFQQRRLSRLALPEQAAAADQAPADRHDSLHAALQEALGGPREDTKRRLLVYLDRVALAGAGQRDTPIVDLGCGRGEWLELLSGRGLQAYGVEPNLMKAERAIALGLDVRHSGLLEHLHGLGDASRSGVTGFHVAEQLEFAALVDLLDEALRVLAPGGILILEACNAETMRVGATDFYQDPARRRPVLPEVMRLVVEHRGFADAEVLRLHPVRDGLLQERTEDARLLNRVLFGPQDFAVVARRI